MASNLWPIARIVVVIPVFNAFAEALRCLRSVMRLSPEAAAIVVIDDASTAGCFSDLIPRPLRRDARLRLYRNAANLGFVKSCNLGIQLAGHADVVLLNSDTEVTQRWLLKMHRVAYSRPDVGTVTALSNNGSICSSPQFSAPEAMPPGYSVGEFARLVERVSDREYVVLPTCVGHCVYLRRTLLDQVQGFDEAAFGRGYGEENDLSCRAQALGYVDLLDDATFVYHRGNSSFGRERDLLAAKHLAVLAERYPEYDQKVQRFWQSGAVAPVHARILDEMVRRWAKPRTSRVLHILHDGPHVARRHPLGGTELHVASITQASAALEQWSLVPHDGRLVFTAHIESANREYHMTAGPAELSELLKQFPVIHVHHLLGFDQRVLTEALREHGNYLVSVHDYFGVCPRVNLLTPSWKHCSGHECSSVCGYADVEVGERRGLTRELLTRARAVLCFSESTREYLHRLLGDGVSMRTLSHGIRALRRLVLPQPPAPALDVPLRVAFLGAVAPHKGAYLIKELVPNERLPCGVPIEWHLLGDYQLPGEEAPSNLKRHGRYAPGELPERLRALQPHLVVVSTVCPETYCLTLDEAWSAGIPALVTPLGAPQDRVVASGAGWVAKEVSAGALLTALNDIAMDPAGLAERWHLVQRVPLRSIEEEVEELLSLYFDLTKGRKKPAVAPLIRRLGGLLKATASSDLRASPFDTGPFGKSGASGAQSSALLTV